jgi:isoleucyl-tRNA synthetase
MPEAPAPQSKPLKSTLNLPQTAFPMKANLPVNEPLRLAQWKESDLYGQIRRARAGAPRYILHDGPPYANGAIHLGHALNKGLKDFIVKSKTMAGFDAPYIPGCDCHGLPIEIKVEEQLGRKRLELPAAAIMEACRAYAQKYVDLQISQFVRLGVFGRWDKPYMTMTRDYEARTLEAFYGFLEKGFVYRGLKPVYWCIHDRTTLAEAEVEYEQHTSPSIYVRYALTSYPNRIHPDVEPRATEASWEVAKLLGGLDSRIYTIIWTTTPWTLPASLAVAFHPEMEYVALATPDATYLVAASLAEQVIAACKLTGAHEVARFPGTALDRATFAHPFLDRTILGVNATYVTADQGTGAVHTAPAHGVDDFATGQRYDLPEVQYVDDAGRQIGTERFGGGQPQPYEGLTVFKSNPVIVELLKEKGALLAISNLEHSYPHCWRCHNPVITRATEQWFIGMDTPVKRGDGSETTLRQLAIEEIDKVVWDPSWGKVRITNMIATRPDWCISRQKIWDVPIAVFLCEQCNRPIVSAELNRAVVALIEREGIEAWRTPAADALLPAGPVCAHCGGTAFRKETDILDVWIDAGVSWFAVCEADPDLKSAYTAFQNSEDVPVLYLEGADQYRGWFHSSLLTSVALRGHAPYSRVVTNGWTLDEQGRALSKSLGNFIDPVAIMDQLGGDIVRLWVASVDFREDVVASMPLLKRLAEEIYRKLRNTFRFLLGALSETDPTTGLAHDFDPRPVAEGGDGIAFDAMQPIDQYILARTAELTGKIRKAYEDFEFHRVYHLLNEFCNSELSAFYLDVLKDRLYTYPIKFKPGNAEQERLYHARRSAQTAIYKITDALARLTAPILSFTADEVYQSLPHTHGSVHLTLFPTPESLAPTPDVSLILSEWDPLLKARSIVLNKLESMRAAKEIGKALEAVVEVAWFDPANIVTFNALHIHAHSLPELFGVSDVTFGETTSLQNSAPPHIGLSVSIAPITKCDRCWRHVADVGKEEKYPTVCLRCAEALDAIDFPPYAATNV